MRSKPYVATWRKTCLTRRRLVMSVAASSYSLAGVALLGCSTKPSPGPRPSGATPTAGTPRMGGIYNASLANNAPLDPQAISQGPTDIISGGVMSRAFRYKTGPDPNTVNNHEIESDLATSAESPDAVTWSLKLRTDAKFHNLPPVNGHSVEAEDIKATFVRALGLAQNPNRGALGMIDPNRIETPDKNTVVFHLNYAFAPFANTLASTMACWILPREALAGTYDPSKQAIGSGPFILDSAVPDVEYVLKRNANWFEHGRPYVDGVRLAVIPDIAQQLAQFSAGHLDEVQVPANELETLRRSNPKATTVKTVPNSGANLYFQLGDASSAFQDVRLRRACSMMIDRQSIAKAVFNDDYATALFVPPVMGKWCLRPDQLDSATAPYYKFNLPEAKKLLDASGASGLTFKYAYAGNSSGPDVGRQAVTQAMNNMLNTGGVKTTLLLLDFQKEWIDAGRGYRQGYFPKDTIAFAANQPFNEVDDLLFSYFSSRSTQNQEHLSDPDLDGMIDKARTIVDENARLKAYLDIQRYLADKTYVVPTGFGYGYILVQPRVQNYNLASSWASLIETYSKVWINL
jgi:peptide/nickel transport system substrate-binding protein